MTSVYTHQTPASLCHAVNTLGRGKPTKVVRFKKRSVSRSSNPSATADGTDLMLRRSCATLNVQSQFTLRAQRGRCRPRSNRAIVDFGCEEKSRQPQNRQSTIASQQFHNRKSTIHNRKSAIFIGAPAGIRTPNQQIMSLLL